MAISSINRFNQIVVPIFENDEKGNVQPNALFHRAVDKLHSRCIEYPFAASRIGDAKTILDVGSVKSNPVWISWLENLPIEVHATDFDAPSKQLNKIIFHQADVRNLPLSDGIFDKVIAVSVIEHIGLESPQVLADRLPKISNDGDLEAVKELARVLKPGGELIMTLPFGMKDELILGNQARSYTIDSIKKFDLALDLVTIEYYEYQRKKIAETYPQRNEFPHLKDIIKRIGVLIGKNPKIRQFLNYRESDDMPGEVTWNNVPMESSRAIHSFHIEGVVCGIWKKPITQITDVRNNSIGVM